MHRLLLLIVWVFAGGAAMAQRVPDSSGPPGDLGPIESALTYHTPRYHDRLRDVLLTRVPAAARLSMLYLPSFAPEALFAISGGDDGSTATVVRANEQIWEHATGEVACTVASKPLPAQFPSRLEQLWRAMLLRVRPDTSRSAVLDGESFVFLCGQLGGRANNPPDGTRANALREIGTRAIAFVDAAPGEDGEQLARLDAAIRALERMLAGAPASGALDGRVPADVDLRPRFAAFGLEPRAQGARPTCSIFTTVAAFEFALACATGGGQRLSVDYCNWAANAATGRHDDGDFFHNALAGYEAFGICRDALWPYAAQFRGDESPPPAALVDGGRVLELAKGLRVRWIRPIGGGAGLDPAQMADLHATLAAGWPVAAGSSHSRLLVGYRTDASVDGGGAFLTLDSALHRFAEVPVAFVRDKVNDAFVVEPRP